MSEYDSRLVVSRCERCRKDWLPPRTLCPACREKTELERVEGAARLDVWTVVHEKTVSGESTTYVLAWGELKRTGKRLLGRIRNVNGSETAWLRRGMDLRVSSDDSEGAVKIWMEVCGP